MPVNRSKFCRQVLVAAMSTCLCTLGAAAAKPVLKLHVPSPDWRDQIIYFLMIDRFNDGDATNNDQGAGEYDPKNGAKYSGGDLRGVTQKLDYIKGLGATAVWMTPPVANQWWDPMVSYGGYHGYWAENFDKIDRHNGTLADYQQLSDQLHRKGMYLVQDIVVNHMGNYFAYGKDWRAANPAIGYQTNSKSVPTTAPTQWPFSQNDPRNPKARALGVFHWTPDILDFGSAEQMHNYQLAGLDDINTESPIARRALRRSYGDWIRKVGVDAFRVDTALYVPPAFFADFLYAKDKQAPGILAVARQTGRQQFHLFGEAFAIDKAFEDRAEKQIDSYMRGPKGEPLMPGMLNFTLYGTAADVFARGRPTSELAYRINTMMASHSAPHLMATFIDNHDVDRILAGGSQAALRQGLLMLMTLPGIPVVYAGTEQGFTESRAAMFKTGYLADGRDHFDTASPLYRFIQSVTALRRGDPVFRRGNPTVLKSNAASAGALAYRMALGKAASVVVFNTADEPTLLDYLATGLPAGTVLRGQFGLDGMPTDLVVGQGGEVSLTLPARAGWVWRVTNQRQSLATPAASLSMTPMATNRVSDNFSLSGTAKDIRRLQLVVDGDLAGATVVLPDADGHWTANVDTARMIDPAIPHQVLAWDEAAQVASHAQTFFVARNWATLADWADPLGDDNGPNGRYTYPTEPTAKGKRTLDIENVRVAGAGGAIKIDVKMAALSKVWSPQNGFDHVAFTVFFEIPDKAGGVEAMPQQNGKLPNGMRWHYRLRVHGWSNALFASTGASASQDGLAVGPAAEVKVDEANRTISFILPSASLGRLTSLKGVKIYLNTWDYDGAYRGLGPVAQANQFGGGDGSKDPLVMDDTPVLVLP